VFFALDDRNFGTAQLHLDASVQKLEESGFLNDGDSFLEQLKSSKVVVAGDLLKQRARFRKHVKRLNGLLDQ
jgi:hypothetical protein